MTLTSIRKQILFPSGFLSFNFNDLPTNFYFKKNKPYIRHGVFYAENCNHLMEYEKELFDYCLLVEFNRSYSGIIYSAGVQIANEIKYSDDNKVNYYTGFFEPEILMTIRLDKE